MMTTGKKIALGLLVGLPLCCCGGGWLTLQAVFGGAARQKDQELAKARAAGIAVDASDLAKLTYVPDAQNAAPLYRKIFAKTDGTTAIGKDLKAVTQGLGTHAKPEDKEKAIEADTRLQPLFAEVRQAAALPGCDFGYDWSLGFKVLFPEFTKLKDLAKALCFDASQKSARGDWRGALDDIAAAQKLGRHAGACPTVVGMLVEIATEAIANRSLDGIIDENSKNVAFLQAAKQVHDGFGPLANYRRSLMGELVLGRISIGQIKSFGELTGSMDPSDGTPPGQTPIDKAVFGSQVARDAFEAKLVAAYRMLITSIPKDPDRWEDAGKASKEFGRRVEADQSITNVLNRILFPVFSEATEAIGTTQAHRHLTDTALRLLINRSISGELPKYLPNYGPTRIDPFTGHALKYLPKGSGFLLYSVGKDRVDDGGITKADDPNAKTVDEVVRIH